MCDSAEDKAAAERLKSVHNERTKLSATYMNGVAIAAIAVGGLAPIAQNHFETMGDLEIRLFFAKLILCLLASFGLHLGASSLAPEDPMTWLQLAVVAAFPVGALLVGFGAFWFAKRAV